MKFVRENWVWIVLPLAIIAAVLAAFCIFGGEPAARDIYTIF